MSDDDEDLASVEPPERHKVVKGAAWVAVEVGPYEPNEEFPAFEAEVTIVTIEVDG